MELHKIEICNLNSLKGEFCIDFMSGQLKGQDLFAITGPTGSGKSTILDAITLALYNRVPRLDGKKGDGDPKAGSPYERLKPGDTENTLTRGEKKGYARVVFEASGQLYRAEWLCELKNVKFGGSHSLYRLGNEGGLETAETVATGNLINEFDRNGVPKDNTVSKAVVDLIGLGYDQFCKACILAQNSFASFLKADDYEKADILEKITGTSIYGRIADVIVKGYEDALKEKTGINDKISGQRLLMITDADKLGQKKAEQESLTQEQENLKSEITTLEKGLAWWNGLEGLTRTVNDAEVRKNAAVEKEQKLLPQRQRLERYDKVGPGMKLLNTEADARREFDNAVRNVEAAQERLKKNLDDIRSKSEEKAEAEKDQKAKESELERLSWAKPIKNNFSLIRSEYRLLNQSVRSLRTAAVRYSPDNGYGLLDEGGLIKEIERLTKGLDPELTLDDQRGRLAEIEKERTLCDNADVLSEQMGQVLELDARDRKDSETILSNTPLQEELAEEIRVLDGTIRSLENRDLAYKRGLLEEGKPCELCGATHHPYATASVFNAEIEGAKGRLGEKKKQKEDVDRIINAAREGILSRKGERNALNASIKALKGRMESADEAYRTVFSKFTPEQQILTLEAKAYELAAWVEKQSEAENTLSLIGLRDFLRDARSHISALDELLPKDWYGRRLADGDGYARFLEEAVGQYNKADNAVSETAGKVRACEASIDTLKKLTPEIEEDINKQGDIRDDRKNGLDRAGSALSKWIDTFNAGDETPVSREELLGWEDDKSDWENIRKGIIDAQNERIECVTLYLRAVGDIEEHQRKAEKPKDEKDILNERERAAHKKLEEGPDSVTERLRTVSGELTAHDVAEKAIAQFKDQMEEAEKKVGLWRRFYNMLGKKAGDKEAKEFRKLAQNYTLGLLLNYANKELCKFTTRYKLKKQNDTSLEIMVEDAGLTERYASSLSGGETFMVSLALALGLSSISSGSVSLKNIFIDEGFGSLDSDTQKTVVGALNTLRAEGKRVGLISHTPALVNNENLYKIVVEKVDDKFSIIDF